MLASRHRPRRTPGGTLLPRTDGRRLHARRFRDLVRNFEQELGDGELSPADQALVGQAANLVLAGEQLQADVINGGPINPDTLVRVSSEARRILSQVRGKADKRKPEGQDALQAYLASSTFQIPADDADHDVEGTEAGDTVDAATEPTAPVT